MSFLTKSYVATIFLASAILAVWSMLTLTGRRDRKPSPKTFRRLHKSSGFVFLALLLVLSYYCARFVRMGGDNLPVRAVIHSLLALALLVVLVLKIVIVQFYKEFARFVPVMGIIVLVLAFLVYATSAGFFFLVRSKPEPTGLPQEVSPLSPIEKEGRGVFERECSFCHHADKADSKLGPGLKGLLKRETFPASGRPATPENVRMQLVTPAGGMPSFKSKLSEEDMGALLAYLETL